MSQRHVEIQPRLKREAFKCIKVSLLTARNFKRFKGAEVKREWTRANYWYGDRLPVVQEYGEEIILI